VSYRTVSIQRVQRRVSARDEQYLLVRFGDGSFATCWDKVLWDLIDMAFDTGTNVTLDICDAEKTGPDGKPYRNIVGYEHPGQLKLL